MAERRRETPEDENLKALEALSAGHDPFPPVPGKPQPPGAPAVPRTPPPSPASEPPAGKAPAGQPPTVKPAARPAAPTKPAQAKPAPAAPCEPIPLAPPVPTVPPPAPAMPAATAHHVMGAAPASGPPRYRCLRCGYPIADLRHPRCNECGRTYTKDTLEWWFSDEERTRFNNGIWLVLAVIFTKLMFIPLIMGLARFGGAVVAGVACVVAMNGKKGTVGGYCGVSGLVIAVIMGLGFSWSDEMAAPYYTLDMVTGCLLLLALLHDPMGGAVGGALPARQIAPVVLFVAPLLGAGCWWLQKVVGANLGLFAGWEPYTPFGFIAPYVAATAVWVFVWIALMSARKMLFANLDGETAE